MCYKNHNYWFFCITSFLAFSLSSLHALASLTLQWDASSSNLVAGYHLYTGTASGAYAQIADEGTATSVNLTSLQPGTTYYFVLTTYASDGSESAPSAEASYTAPVGGTPLSAPSQTVLMLNGSQINIGTSGTGTVTQVVQPRYGSAVINSGSSMTYRAASGYPGHDSFVYTVTSPGVASASGTIFVTSQANFTGLITNQSPDTIDTGLLQITAGMNGKFTGRLTIGALVQPISGTFDANGNATTVISWDGIPVVTLTLNLNTVTGLLTGSMQVSSGQTASTVSANVLTYSAANKAPQTGAYTMLLPPQANPPAGSEAPQGVGYLRLVVAANGAATLVGKLADNTALTAAGWVAPDGTLTIYHPLYGSRGFISGILKFENITTSGVESDLDGNLVWQRPAGATNAPYPSGFATSIDTIGSVYTTSTDSIAALLPAGQKKAMVSLAGSALATPVADQVSVVGTNVLKESTSGKTRLVMQLSPVTGLFTGSFVDPTTGKISTIGGAVFQKRSLGAGSFFLSAKSGSVLVQNSNSGLP